MNNEEYLITTYDSENFMYTNYKCDVDGKLVSTQDDWSYHQWACAYSDKSKDEMLDYFENHPSCALEFLEHLNSSYVKDSITNLFISDNDKYNGLVGLINSFLSTMGYDDLQYCLSTALSNNLINGEYITDILSAAKTRYGLNNDATTLQWNGNGILFDLHTEQGHKTGDCWLLSCLMSGAQLQEFKDYISSIIKIDNDNKTYTITLHGKDYKYTFEQILKAKELSNGDLDVRAFEMAIRDSLASYGITIVGGDALKFMFAFALNNSPNDKYEPPTLKDLESIRYGNRFGFVGCQKGDVIYFIDQNGKKVPMSSQHAFAIIGADNKFVYIKDPHDSTKTLKLPIEEFYKCQFLTLDLVEFIQQAINPENYKNLQANDVTNNTVSQVGLNEENNSDSNSGSDNTDSTQPPPSIPGAGHYGDTDDYEEPDDEERLNDFIEHGEYARHWSVKVGNGPTTHFFDTDGDGEPDITIEIP